MKKSITYITVLVILSAFFPLNICAQKIIKTQEIKINIDGAVQFQKLDGIGVNANTSSWNGNDLKPAIDMLVNTANLTIWRLIVETVRNWEDVNDNEDPFTFDWDYYNKLYETPKFRKVWEMVSYLNQKGITDNLMISFVGFAPPWMGIKVIEPKYEQEYTEMLASFFYYAIEKKQLKIGLIAPTNESDWYNYSEGPHLNGNQLARITRMLIERMEALKIMENVRIVAPDVVVFENAKNSFIPALMEDPIVWSKNAHLGFHSYGGYTYDIQGYIKSSPHPATTYWMTEFNSWCKGCDDGKLGVYDYNYGKEGVKFLFEFLENNATGCLIFEGYDSKYEHDPPAAYSRWGLFASEPGSNIYNPRKTFYTFSQVTGKIAPGSTRISVESTLDSLKILAFYNPSNKGVTVVGINQRNESLEFQGSIANLPELRSMELSYTNQSDNHQKGRSVKIKDKSFKTIIPANCIFSLTGSEGK